MNLEKMVKIGQYTFARELANGEWAIYRGRWSDRARYHTTELRVERDAGQPIRFVSLEEVKEYVQFRWGV